MGDMVEWLAQQPWCDGSVGTAGICYFSSMQLHVAAEQPPHLKCIAPWEIFGDDLYNHGQYEGGVFNIFLYGLYTGTYPARCGYAPNDVRSAMEMNTPPEELKKIVDEAMLDPDLKQYPYLLHLLQYPKKNPVLFDFMLNKLDGPYYRERSVSERLDKIKVPCYVGGPLFSFFSQPQMNVFNKVDVPKKMFLYTRHEAPARGANTDEVLRWYDYWLKGIDTRHHGQASDSLPTTVLEWQAAQTWPLRTRCGPTSTSTVWSTGLRAGHVERRARCLPCSSRSYVTESAAGSPMSAGRCPRTTGDRASAHHLLCRPRPGRHLLAGGSARGGSDAIYPLASGWLKASHRTLDPQRTTPGDRP
jgi:putative CocE/NonD family hydrolase